MAPRPKRTVIRDPFAVRFHLAGTYSGKLLLTPTPLQATLGLGSLAKNCKETTLFLPIHHSFSCSYPIASKARRDRCAFPVYRLYNFQKRIQDSSRKRYNRLFYNNSNCFERYSLSPQSLYPTSSLISHSFQ